MANYSTITFRPRRETEMDVALMVEWCNEHGLTFSAVINSFLPAISYALKNKVFIDEKTKEIYVRSDFGDVKIEKSKSYHRRTEYLT